MKDLSSFKHQSDSFDLVTLNVALAPWRAHLKGISRLKKYFMKNKQVFHNLFQGNLFYGNLECYQFFKIKKKS